MRSLLLALLTTLLLGTTAHAQEPCVSKIRTYLQQSGYTAFEASPCKVWLVNGLFSFKTQGEGLQGLLLVGVEGEIVVIGTVVRPQALASLSRQQLVQLLKQNNDLDYVKIGIDKDGDLFVRAELRLTHLTGDDFSHTVRQVIAGGNRVYELLRQ